MAVTLDDAKKLSQQVLNDNYVVEPPIDVYELAKKYGLLVEEQAFPAEYAHVSGFITQDNGLPHVVVNANDSKSRKNFTVAHELGHWLMHKDKLQSDPKIGILFRIPLGKLNADPLEKQANTFAANLLVPADMLKELAGNGRGIKELAEVFGVSEDVIGYRLNHVRIPKMDTKQKK